MNRLRPAIFGKQIVTRNGILCGVNLGYSMYTDQERDVISLINVLNNNITEKEPIKLIDQLAFNKRVKQDIKKMDKFNNTPFRRCIVRPSTRYIRREIIINNDELKSQYNTMLLEDANYTLLIFGHREIIDMYNKKLEGRRKFNEADLFYMKDYNFSNAGDNTTGKSSYTDIGIGTISTIMSSSWGRNGLLLVINKDSIYSSIPDNIENNLKAGGLALVSEPAGLFRDRGLGLVFLNNMYK